MTDGLNELKKICEDIKRLVPSAIPQEPTGQFETFISGLNGKVKNSELDAIHRAHNYFNQLLGTLGVRPEIQKNESKDPKDIKDTKDINDPKGPKDTKNESTLDQVTKEDMILRLLLLMEPI